MIPLLFLNKQKTKQNQISRKEKKLEKSTREEQANFSKLNSAVEISTKE